MRRITDHAVVIGGSMAGLVTARVLAEVYDRVTVIDRDELPTAPQHRRGAAQSRHAHGLLSSGLLALEELFPGLTADLASAGAPSGDVAGQGRWYVNGHLLARTQTGMTGIGVSRPLLEAQVRARVRALPNVTIRDRCDVLDPLVAEGGHRVTGVRLLGRAGGSAAEALAADLVVDASGRGSRTPSWLDALGYPRPPEERIRIRLRYASRHYRLTTGDLGGDAVVMVGPTLPCPRGGILITQEAVARS